MPQSLVGRRFGDVLVDLKHRLNCLPVALRSVSDGVKTNPATDELLRDGDRLLVIAETYPTIA